MARESVGAIHVVRRREVVRGGGCPRQRGDASRCIGGRVEEDVGYLLGAFLVDRVVRDRVRSAGDAGVDEAAVQIAATIDAAVDRTPDVGQAEVHEQSGEPARAAQISPAAR